MRFGGLLLAAWLGLGTPLAAWAEPLYTVTRIAGPGSWARAINSTGQLAGTLTAGDHYHAFYYDGASLHDIGTLGGFDSVGQAINDSGAVVGSADSNDTVSGFIYAGGTLNALPPGLLYANGINAAGAVTGTGAFPTSTSIAVPRAFIYAGGAATNLGVLPGYDFPDPGTFGAAINGAGHVAGQAITGTIADFSDKSFLFRDGVMEELGGFGDLYGMASALNDHDQVAGGAVTRNATASQAFIWENGVVRFLGALTPDGTSFAYGLNNTGQVVGTADDAEGQRAFLYDGATMRALDDLIDPASGWSIMVAHDINDRQQIAAQACRHGTCYAVRLDPIPEPGTAWLLAAGLLAPVLWSAGKRPRRERASLPMAPQDNYAL